MKAFNLVLTSAVLIALTVGPAPAAGPAGVLDATYRINSQSVRLVNGRCEHEAAPGSTAKVVTQAVQDPVLGDLDGDGQQDAALFLSHAPGGSGTFSYVAGAIAKDGRWQGTNAVFIGDRVMPLTIRIDDGVIVVRYLDRSPEAPMAVMPSIEKTIEIELVGGHLEVLQP